MTEPLCESCSGTDDVRTMPSPLGDTDLCAACREKYGWDDTDG